MPTFLDSLNKIDLPKPAPLHPDIFASSALNGRWFPRGDQPVASLSAFFGLPGVTVIAPNTLGNPAEVISAAQNDSNAVLCLEDARLYPCKLLVEGQGDMLNWMVDRSATRYPIFTLQPEYPPALTIATYGYNFELVRAAALKLIMEREIFCEIVLCTQLSPVEFAPLTASLAFTRRLVTVESGPLDFGWGAELVARAAALDIRRLRTRRVSSPFENYSMMAVVDSVLGLLGQTSP